LCCDKLSLFYALTLYHNSYLHYLPLQQADIATLHTEESFKSHDKCQDRFLLSVSAYRPMGKYNSRTFIFMSLFLGHNVYSRQFYT
jgi:hypothetical protein